MPPQPSDPPAQNQDNPTTYHGSCLCGHSSYTLTSPPTNSIICHCLNCRKWSGSVFAANLLFPLSSIIPSGNTKQYIDRSSTSGNELHRTFCGDCGSCLYTEVPWAGVVSVARGAVEEESKVLGEPEIEFWCARKEDWVDVKGIKQRFDGNA